jgi:hypothetical protein
METLAAEQRRLVLTDKLSRCARRAPKIGMLRMLCGKSQTIPTGGLLMPETPKSLYARLGGHDAIAAVYDDDRDLSAALVTLRSAVLIPLSTDQRRF